MESRSFYAKFLGRDIPSGYCRDTRNAKVYLNELRKSSALLFGIDTETMALPEFHHYPKAALSPHLSTIRLLQIFDGRVSYIFDLMYLPFEMFIPLLEEKRFLAHNAKFDLEFFIKLGVKKMDIGCTMQLARLLFHAIYPTDDGLDASLAGLVKLLFKTDILKKVQASDWSVKYLTFEQIEYAALDAVAVLEVGKKLAPAMHKKHLEKSYGLLKESLWPVAEMELNGIGFNEELHRGMVEVWKAELYEKKKELLRLTRLSKLTADTLAKYLSETLDEETLSYWPRTKTGKLSTSADTFSDFGHLPFVAPFSKYKKRATLCSTFGSALGRMLNPKTFRLHGGFDPSGTRTGRLSSSRPNMQNLPRTPDKDKMPDELDIRECFEPREGHVFLCADYSQIELRVAAEVSQDKVMLDAYRKGIDLHELTASKVSGKPLKEVTKDERQKAKALNFGLLFGLGARKFAHYAHKSYGVDVSQDEASDAVATFRETYAGYRAWQLRQSKEAPKTLSVRTPVGKIRALPVDNTYGTSMNTPIQGGAAECMLYSLVFLSEAIKAFNLNIKFANCVHDELLLECPFEEIEEGKELLVTCMTEGFKAVFPQGITKGLVDVQLGFTWAEPKSKSVQEYVEERVKEEKAKRKLHSKVSAGKVSKSSLGDLRGDSGSSRHDRVYSAGAEQLDPEGENPSRKMWDCC